MLIASYIFRIMSLSILYKRCSIVHGVCCSSWQIGILFRGILVLVQVFAEWHLSSWMSCSLSWTLCNASSSKSSPLICWKIENRYPGWTSLLALRHLVERSGHDKRAIRWHSVCDGCSQFQYSTYFGEVFVTHRSHCWIEICSAVVLFDVFCLSGQASRASLEKLLLRIMTPLRPNWWIRRSKYRNTRRKSEPDYSHL